jgi:4-aminobutyrate aminotransferase/(S)-3-amino-2-methylpropionate transaminase
LLATGKPGVIAFEGGYHGLTSGSLAVTWRSHFRAPFERRLYAGVAFAPFPATAAPTGTDGASAGVGGAAASLEVVRKLLSAGAPNGDPIGAVIVEPVQGRAGVRIPADGFMAELSRLAPEAGALVIADELLTGMGRCGAVLASERVGLEPDLVCLGKALGAGLPISACLGRPDVMAAWPPSEGEAVHTSTFLGHPLACAAALAALESFDAEAVPARAEALGARLRDGLAERLSGVPGVADIRGLGALVGIELAQAEGRGGVAARVAVAALRRGVLVLPAGDAGEVVELTPPVVLTEAQADHAVEVLVRAIEEVV